MGQSLGHLDEAQGLEGLRFRTSEEGDFGADDRLTGHGRHGHVGGALAPDGPVPGLRAVHRIGLQDTAELGLSGPERPVGTAFVVLGIPAEGLDVQGLQSQREGVVADHTHHFADRLADAGRIGAPQGQIRGSGRRDLHQLQGEVAGLGHGPDPGAQSRLAEPQREPLARSIPGRAVGRMQGSAAAQAQDRGRLLRSQIFLSIRASGKTDHRSVGADHQGRRGGFEADHRGRGARRRGGEGGRMAPGHHRRPSQDGPQNPPISEAWRPGFRIQSAQSIGSQGGRGGHAPMETQPRWRGQANLHHTRRKIFRW